MARRKLTLHDQLMGIKAAIRSRRTPPQLREGLTKRAAELEKQIRLTDESNLKPKSHQPGTHRRRKHTQLDPSERFSEEIAGSESSSRLA